MKPDQLRSEFAVVMICAVGHGREVTTGFFSSAEQGKIQNVKKSRNTKLGQMRTPYVLCVCVCVCVSVKHYYSI